MDSNRILGFILPTCYPDRAFNKLFSDESLNNMKILSPISTFLINFQPNWTDDLIKKAVSKLESYGFNVKYSFNTYEIKERGCVPMNKIRNDCSELLDCAIYVMIDDDFIFGGGYGRVKKTAGEQYVHAAHYMTTHEKCGIVSMRFKPLKNPPDEIVPDNHITITPLVSMYRTGYGMFVRSLKNISSKGKFMPTDSLELVGGGEEKVLAGHVLSQGLYPARMNRSNIINQVGGDPNSVGWDANWILKENNDKYILDNFNKAYGGRHNYNLIDVTDYTNKGGLVYTEELAKELDYDYTDCNESELICQIINYWRNK